jgi:hypothetical protein
MSDEGFLCQDLEAKLFKWFEGRLDATKIKREPENKPEPESKPEPENHISDFYVGEVVRWKYNGEHGVVSKINETTSTLEVIFDSGYDSLFWVDQLEKVVSS